MTNFGKMPQISDNFTGHIAKILLATHTAFSTRCKVKQGPRTSIVSALRFLSAVLRIRYQHNRLLRRRWCHGTTANLVSFIKIINFTQLILVPFTDSFQHFVLPKSPAAPNGWIHQFASYWMLYGVDHSLVRGCSRSVCRSRSPHIHIPIGGRVFFIHICCAFKTFRCPSRRFGIYKDMINLAWNTFAIVSWTIYALPRNIRNEAVCAHDFVANGFQVI